MRFIAFILLALTLQAAPAPAQDQWRDFKSDSDGFSVSLPRTPVISSRRIPNSNATQTMFLIEEGQVAFLVSVIQMEKGTGPKNPNKAYFDGLMKNYTEGSGTKLRTGASATVAGQPGFEGISDVDNGTHIVKLTTSGDRVFMLVYAGAKGQERGPDATRFQNSFKLLN